MKNLIYLLSLLVFSTSFYATTLANVSSKTYGNKTMAPVSVKSVMGTSYYATTNDGYWHETASWNGAGIPPSSGVNNLDITINDYITYNGAVSGDPMEFNNNFTILVKNGATLEIFADIDINNNFTFTVETGGNLIIHGDMSMGNVISGIIDGAVQVDENLTINGGGSSSITGTGTLEVGGTVTDPHSIVLPALINNERYLVVDGGSWIDQSSWATTSGGTPGVTIPSDQSKVYIESGYDVTIPNTVLLQDLNISDSSIVTVNPGATLQVTNISNSGQIILASNATGTGALLYNGTTPGDVAFYRYVSANKFCYVSSPYINSPYTSYYTTIYDAKNPNFYEYDETIGGTAAYGWKAKKSGSLASGKGYALYYNKNYSYPISGDTLATGDINVNVTYTSTGVYAEDGWTLLGNPYPSNIDATAFLNANISGTIEGTIYYWDDDGSNGSSYSASDYSTYTLAGGVAGDNGTVPNGYIAPGQAFFIKTAANGTVTFNNSMKAATAGTVFNNPPPASAENTNKSSNKAGSANTAGPPNKSSSAGTKNSTNTKGSANTKTELRLSLISEKAAYNELLLTFADSYTEGYDNFFDGRKKVQASSIAFYSLLDNEKLAIQALPTITKDTEVNLGLFANVAGTYTISTKAMENFDVLVNIYLYDKLLDKTTELSKNGYTFTANGSTDDRFVVKVQVRELESTTWQGNAGDDFFDENKWTNGAPSLYKSVIIPAGTIAELNGNLSCYNLLVESGATMILGQNCSFDVIKNISIASNNNNWGIILDSGTTSIKADLAIELDNTSFNDFSSPVAGAEIQQLGNLLTADVNTYMAIQKSWNRINNTSQKFETGSGYQILPDNTNQGKAVLSGTLNTGHYDLYLNAGINYIGNPYLSYIDWGNAEAQNGWSSMEKVSGSIWTAYGKSGELNNTSFAVYNRVANVSINNADRNINPMQAFWIYATDETVIGIDNNARSIGLKDTDTALVDGLRLIVSGNSLSDETIIAFSEQANDEYDPYDSYKMLATDKNYPQLYAVNNSGDRLAINTMAKVDWESEVSVNLIFTAGNEGGYTISLSNIGYIPEDVVVYIEDEFDTLTAIDSITPYSFYYATVNEDKTLTLIFTKPAATDDDVADDDVADDDVTDGDVTDDDVSDGDVTDDDVTDDDVTDGDVTDGDVTDGDVTDDDATKGDITNVENIYGEKIKINAKNRDIYITIPKTSASTKAFIYDVTGKLIINSNLKAGINNLRVDSEGIYLIKICNSKEAFTQKIMIW